MSIASLHIWSSIKIPLSVYAGRNKNKTYLDSWSKIQEEDSNLAKELINLRVPIFTNQNSVSDDIYIKPLPKQLRFSLTEEPLTPERCFQGSTRGRKLDRIQSVSVPEVFSINEIYGRDSNEDFDELSGSLDFDESSLDDGGRFDDIPSVKPWTAEELERINKKYSLLEEKVKKESDRKKTQTINTTNRNRKSSSTPPTAVRCLNEHKSLPYETFDPEERTPRVATPRGGFQKPPNQTRPNLQQRSHSPTITSGRKYYEAKLTELYMIELGIKR